MKTVQTTCPYCGVGCGVDAHIEHADPQTAPQVNGPGTEDQFPRGNIIAVEGSKHHPANLGRLCVKGSALHETLSLKDRLLTPRIGGEQVSWEHALTSVADGFKKIIDQHGPDSVAFYLSGQLLTEDYYVANKLMKGFIGSANVDTNSRLCMASAVVGYKRAFGSDTVPCNYEDLELCDLLVMIGSNAAWTHPVLYQRIAAAKQKRPDMRVVVIDPRRTNTCDIADLHLPIAPGSDASLFNGLLNYLAANELHDQDYINKYTEGFDQALSSCKDMDLATLATACDVEPELLETFFEWYGETDKTISFYSQGINQSSSGTDKCNAIINCHLATGRIGKEGMGPFSITGQPNAMGGREVGGLANQLAAHMQFNDEDIDRVGRFWQAEKMATRPGLLAVDLFDAIDEGKVKAVWIMATNPVVSLPNADKVKRALDKCDLVVVSDCIEKTDTADMADILLPALGWSEKEGTVTNSERRISLQPALNPPAGEARDDWWIICQVAKKMGWGKAFDYKHARDIFVEHARLSAFENHGTRSFNIEGLADLTLDEYKNLQPVQWPVLSKETSDGAYTGTSRMFTEGRFYTASGKARFIAIEPRTPVESTSPELPFTLNTGRIRDQWHTMTRTGKSERLNNHIDAPYLSINPEDAQQLGMENGQLVEVSNHYGCFQALVKPDESIRKKELFAPLHWTAQNSSMGRMGAVVNPHCDPVSGQPESKQTPVSIKVLKPGYWGALACKNAIPELPADYWVKSQIDDRQSTWGFRYEFATHEQQDWAQWLENIYGEEVQLARYADLSKGVARVGVIQDSQLVALLFQAPLRSDLPSAAWLSETLSSQNFSLINVLSGKSPSGEDRGSLVCSCFEVGDKQIMRAISGGADSVEKLGQQLRCGTNCGSCIPELKQHIQSFNLREAS